MVNLCLGLLLGGAGLHLYHLTRTDIEITWFGWVLFALGAGSIVMGFDVLTGSIIEHEMQAGWMGLGFFTVTGAVLWVSGWRYGVYQKLPGGDRS